MVAFGAANDASFHGGPGRDARDRDSCGQAGRYAGASEAFRWGHEGDYRLRIGRYRVMYRVGTDVITIGRVDFVSDK
ncbi:MAG TPA: hypothetical protein VFU43_21010 [Streptosporangiaceae bacterium]|nr:hypothetical protein [Streptosporangiaceae bacterium]